MGIKVFQLAGDSSSTVKLTDFDQKKAWLSDFRLTPQGTVLTEEKKKKNVPLGDIACKVCALMMNIDAHILNNCSFWISDAVCCHLTLEKQCKKKAWCHMYLSKKKSS